MPRYYLNNKSVKVKTMVRVYEYLKCGVYRSETLTVDEY